MERKNVIILIIAIIVFGYQNIKQSDFKITSSAVTTEEPSASLAPLPFSNFSYVLPAGLDTLRNSIQETLPSPTPYSTVTPTPTPSPVTTPLIPSVSPSSVPSPQIPQGAQYAGDTTTSRPTKTSYEHTILLQTTAGTVIYASRAHTMFPMASLTKLMTAALVLEHGVLEDVITISNRAESAEGDIAALREGETFSIREVLAAMLIASSNDAAIAFEDYFAQKGLNLVSLMNEKARLWGLLHTVFKNPTGLDEAGHHSTAHDLALLTHRLLEDSRYDPLWEITRTKNYTIISSNKNLRHELQNSNRLLNEIPFIQGGKTGKTVQAKECLILVLEKDSTKYILVILGSDDRFEEARSIIKNHL